jgi:hypothetical protein
MTIHTALLLLACLLALIAALLGFDTFHANGDPHVLGWLGASLAAFTAAEMAP